MIANNSAWHSLKILGEIVRDIAYFPVWWYTRGLVELIERLFNFIADRQRSLALAVWMKNILKPMYAQYDWQGRLISILMRVVQIILRSLVLLFWVIAVFVVFILWVILPPLVIYEIIFQLNG